MFLSEDDLYNLTGFKRYSAQARWLRENRFEFVLRANGQPRVLRVHLDARLGGTVTDNSTNNPEPNWEAI